jgi:ABC-type uncharacterized transport system auxiliary subunit
MYLGAAVLVLLSGCAALSIDNLVKQPPAVIQYYQVDYPPPTVRVAKPVSGTLMIQPLRISAEYDRDTLVYRDPQRRAGIYPYDQWFASPAKQLTEKLMRDFEAAGMFQAVITVGTFQKPDYSLLGSIREIGELREDGRCFGATVVSFTFTKASAESTAPMIVFQREYSERVPCTNDNRVALVAAVSTALQNTVSNLLLDVRAATR